MRLSSNLSRQLSIAVAFWTQSYALAYKSNFRTIKGPLTASVKMNYAPVSDNEDFTTDQSRQTDECSRCINRCDCTMAGPCCVESLTGCFAAFWGGVVAMAECCGECCVGCCQG